MRFSKEANLINGTFSLVNYMLTSPRETGRSHVKRKSFRCKSTNFSLFAPSLRRQIFGAPVRDIITSCMEAEGVARSRSKSLSLKLRAKRRQIVRCNRIDKKITRVTNNDYIISEIFFQENIEKHLKNVQNLRLICFKLICFNRQRKRIYLKIFFS